MNNNTTKRIAFRSGWQLLTVRAMTLGILGMFYCSCMGIGATAGVRKSLSKANDEEVSGIYGGLHSPMPFGINEAGGRFNEKVDGVDDQATFALGLTYNLLIGKSGVRHSIMPDLSLTTKPASILSDYGNYGAAYGGNFGLGVEFGGGGVAFQSQTCATVRTSVHTHLCGRYSSFKGGWLGWDFNGALPPPFDVSSTAQGITAVPTLLYGGY